MTLMEEHRTHERNKRGIYGDMFTENPRMWPMFNIEDAEYEDESDFFLDSDEDKIYMIHLPKKRNLPRDVILKDIKSLTVEHFTILPWGDVKMDEMRLESLKLINVTLEHLTGHFMRELIYNLKEFIMEKVEILRADSEAIFLESPHNEEATIKIINSTFDIYLLQFLKCKVARVS